MYRVSKEKASIKVSCDKYEIEESIAGVGKDREGLLAEGILLR